MAKSKSPGQVARPADPDDGRDVALIAPMLQADYTGPRVMSCIDVTTRAGKRRLVNAENPPTFRPDQINGKVFRMAEWIAVRREFHDDERNEDRTGVQITLFDPDGKSLRFASDAVVRFLDTVRTHYGNGPWTEPIFITVTPYETKNSRRSFACMEVDPDDVEKGMQTW